MGSIPAPSPIGYGTSYAANAQTGILNSNGQLISYNGPKNYIANSTIENALIPNIGVSATFGTTNSIPFAVLPPGVAWSGTTYQNLYTLSLSASVSTVQGSTYTLNAVTVTVVASNTGAAMYVYSLTAPTAGTATLATGSGASSATVSSVTALTLTGGTYALSASNTTPLAGNTSFLMSVSSASATSGDLLSFPSFTIDAADRASILQIKFSYKYLTGAPNMSGTSANSHSIIIWDVTNGAWIQPAGTFNIVGNGKAMATFQTPSNGSVFQLCICASGAGTIPATYSLQIDEMFVGPQITAQGAAMSDWVAYTPTITGFGTVTGVSFYSRREGDSLQVRGLFSSGTSTAVASQISLGYNGSNANVTIDTSKISTGSQIVGMATVGVANTTTFSWTVISSGANTYVGIGAQTSTSGSNAVSNGSVVASSGNAVELFFTVPIVGWSSNTVQSADTDTRVIACQTSAISSTTATNGTALVHSSVLYDTAGIVTGGAFKAPVTGVYDIVANGYYTTGTAFNMAVYVNGAVRQAQSITCFANTLSGGSTSVSLNSGDVVTLVPTASSTFATTIMYVSFSRKSGPAVVQATESVNAKYTNASAQSIPSGTVTTVTGWTKVKDTHGWFNTSTGVYSFGVSGEFRAVLSASMIPGTANTGILAPQMTQAGSTSYTAARALPFGTANNTTSQVSDSFNVLAGDTLTLQVYQNNGASVALAGGASYNTFSIERVGN